MGALSFPDFRAAVLEEFPQLRELFDGDDELPYNQMGVFGIFTQRAKGRADWDTYERCIRIADRLLAKASPELEGALQVSYLEHLDFEGPRGPKAWSLLTLGLQTAWRRITAQNELAVPVRQKRKGRRL